VHAVSSVSLAIEPGSATALMGPNGAGKTTLLKLCATLLTPSAGKIEVDGIDAARDGGAVRARIAVLGHDSSLYGDLTATENLTFTTRLHGIDGSADRVRGALDRVGLRTVGRRPVRTFSRGMQQRCAIARVLLQQPRLLLLDEPATGLDLAARGMLHELIAELRQKGTTILLTTHDIDESLAICDSAVLMARGRIRWQGSIRTEMRSDLEARLRAIAEEIR